MARQFEHLNWTHPSVRAIANDDDPIQVVLELAKSLALDAFDAGWDGPPFDPFFLADHLHIPVVPREDIHDARTVPVSGDRLQIEFNPNRPKARIRYSLAHELAHTLFPDCRDRIRNRLAHEHMQGDDWQLEMLCNLAAAELLMPVGSFPQLRDESLSIDNLMALRSAFQVSAEAILLRFVRLTDQPCAVFACSRIEQGVDESRFQLDYAIPSNTADAVIPAGFLVPSDSQIAACSAIGFTAKGDEEWGESIGLIHFECVGVTPYPDRTYARVIGLVTPQHPTTNSKPRLTYVKGDATSPRAKGTAIVAHIVNDKTSRWGAGFAKAVARKWTSVQEDFQAWADADRANLRLGNCHVCQAEDKIIVFSMICQHGYGESATPRIRYNALEACLDVLFHAATEYKATIHMPRIGCGQAGGKWEFVSELINDSLCARGIEVTVYDLPHENWSQSEGQRHLF